MTDEPVLVLASNSPRRSSLLELGGWQFLARPMSVDESLFAGENPKDYVIRLAETKARACADISFPGEVILAADTTVSLEGDILGKPKNPAEAETMLRRLRGRKHQVVTAISLLSMDTGRLITDSCVTDVPMRPYSEDEIDAYILTGDPLDKAGAYAIQHAGFHPVESLEGCYASVMGLPLCHLARNLSSMGLPPGKNIPAECLSVLGYDCPISTRVMYGEDVG